MSSQRSAPASRPNPTLGKWLPFLFWARSVNRSTLFDDLMAGLTGAVIVLPQGIAYALIAGLPPEYGLYTAIITPVVAGLFGSSLHLISGPTAAISIVVLSVVSSVVPPDSHEFIPAVLTLTLLAGLIQFGLGVAKLGTLVNFISHTVVIGFTCGAAIVIGTSQLKYALAIPVPAGSSFFETWRLLVSQLETLHVTSLVIALTTIFSTLLFKKINRKLPTMLIGMIAGSLVCWLLDGASQGVALVGALSGNLPPFSVPVFDVEVISSLIPGALAVAILGLVEAVSIARAIAIRSGQRINGNQEFIGQGLSNVVGGLFSCYAGSGSFTRTGVNYDSGAKTPLAAVFAALAVVLILLLAPGITSLLPLPAMAGAILLIVWGLIDIPHIKHILHSSREETAVLLVTFCSTLIVELEFAIYLGVSLSLILYLRKTSRPRIMEVAPRTTDNGTDLRSLERFNLSRCPQLSIIRIDGSIFFGAVDHIQEQFHSYGDHPDGKYHLLILCSGINFIDVAGAEMLSKEIKRLKSKDVYLRFCALKNTVKDELTAAGYLDALGPDLFYDTVDEALSDLVQQQLDPDICAGCTTRIFKQCPPLPGSGRRG